MAQISQQQLTDYVATKDGLSIATRVNFTQFPIGGSLINVLDLSQLDFSYLNLLSAINGNGCNFQNTKWINTTLNNCNFQSNVAANPNVFTNAYFENVNASSYFYGIPATLNRSTMSNVTMINCNFMGANLRNIRFTNAILKNCDFSKADFGGSIFEGTTVIENCSFNHSLWQQANGVNPRFSCSIINCDFRDARITQAEYVNANFVGCNFNDSTFAFAPLANQTVSFEFCSFEQVFIPTSANVAFNINTATCNLNKSLKF